MPTPLRTTTTRTPRRTRKDTANRPRPETPIYVTGFLIAGSVLTLTFDQPVLLAGVPGFRTDLETPVAVSAARTAADKVAITYSETVEGAVTLFVGFRDPAIRNASGGYVTSNSVVL
jgi:hypothetical protein